MNAAAAASAAPPAALPLDFDRLDWRFESRGHYLLHVADPRGLRQIFHPWAPADSGDCGALTARVVLPSSWSGPVWLNLFAEDNYVADGWPEVRPAWTHTYAAAHHLPGHRFKQVLVDGRLVWERDVGDPEGDSTYVHIDLGQPPATAFDLTLRVYDRVGTAQPLPGDEFFLGIWSWDGQADPRARERFYTRVVFGDVALSSAPLAWRDNPARRPVPFAPVPASAAAPARRERHTFRLDAPAGLPADGYPATWGVPFARGRLPPRAGLRLLGTGGQDLPLQTRVLARWDDGSARWVLLDFPARPQDRDGGVTMEFGQDVAAAPPRPGLSATQEAGGVRVDTGPLRFRVGAGSPALLDSVELVTGPGAALVARAVSGRVVARDGWERRRCAAVTDEVAVEESGPERVAVLARGRLRDGDFTFGRFALRVHAFRDRPYLRLSFRVFNDTDVPAQLVEEISLRLDTTLEGGEAQLGDQRLVTGPSESERLLVRQHRADGYEVFRGDDTRLGSGAAWEGPLALQAGGLGVAGAVRHFSQLYPKRMWAGSGGQVAFDLFVPTVEYEQYVMTRGEARRHDLLLTFYEGEVQESLPAFAAFARPPVLLSSAWYAGQEALGRGAPLTPDLFPDLAPLIVGSGAPGLACTQPLGLRNWPDGYSDSIYNAYRGTWSNMYQEVDYGALAVSLLAGRRDFYDYAEAYQDHFIDLDICHHHPDPAFVGACYGIAPYHTGSQPYALNAPVAGLFLRHRLTGDADALDAAVGIADWLVRQSVGEGAGSGRAVGWPLRSAVIAYENTADERYLAFASRLARSALQTLHPRLGYFSEPPATWHYRGGVPGMNAILAAGLMRYWRASGDAEVGRACSQIAHDMAYLWMSPTEPGLLLGADPLQQVHIAGYALQDVLPLLWGYELTGDPAFLDYGNQVVDASILAEPYRGQALGLSRYWDLQDLLYYQALYHRLPTGTR